jgi:hypothetical protein
MHRMRPSDRAKRLAAPSFGTFVFPMPKETIGTIVKHMTTSFVFHTRSSRTGALPAEDHPYDHQANPVPDRFFKEF